MLPLQSFLAKVEATPNAAYLHQPAAGEWQTFSYAEVAAMARKVAAGLVEFGCEKGDKVAVVSKNCADWIIVDLGIMMAGMVSVPIYPNAGESTLSHVVSHSEAKLVFIGKLDDYAAVDNALPDHHLVTMGGYRKDGLDTLQDWFNRYGERPEIVLPEGDDLWTIVYTSGSTGVPKGVGLNYSNVRASSKDLPYQFYEVDDRYRVLCYLPLAHVAERSAVAIGSMYYDVEVFFNESVETFVADLHHARVTSFVSVPRLWAKFQAQVLAQIDFDTLNVVLDSDQGEEVARSIREKLGFGECKMFISGTAPIAPSLLNWYSNIGVDICEGWGMTETSGVAAANAPFDSSKLGTIGVPVNGAEMKLSDDGEILIKGATIFGGYYKNPEATAESFVDGWFRTGDCAELSDDGAWRIIGRMKEQFKTAKGKYVAPVPIESMLSANPYIEQVCVGGSGHSQPYALLVLAEGIKLAKDALAEELDKTIQNVNAQLESHERLSGALIVSEPWSIENEMLTPTMKLKRSNIESHYEEKVDGLRGILWE
ncbi:AMP-binding protein [Spongiibacter sp. KMU-166]|uniref:AMP-binding protein n=2 Tax=Spongiibacter thalassae TaxID=2721624 RepID=A0ABX1GHL0_9GAMM|nr:AMP-binding protein [Spongiibacter thalassae]